MGIPIHVRFFNSFTEGQRKANFEECDAKKRECSDKIANLKKDIKILQVKFAKAKNVIIQLG